ncbi:hypothetical protein B1A_09118 [mine drainage metagenome]|uniref:Uncharacterized protein n=1 Tax=mine drainage metagenome TaxID=410659 RepID=T1A3S1_9ZZZZ
MNTNAVVKLATLRHLVEANSVRGASIVGEKGGWSVAVRFGQAERVLAGKDGVPRLFVKVDAAVKQLLGIGLVSFEVHGSDYEAAKLRASRPDRSAAMKEANEYGRWLKAEVGHTAQRVANGEAKLFTQAQAEARGAKKRGELLKRRKASS